MAVWLNLGSNPGTGVLISSGGNGNRVDPAGMAIVVGNLNTINVRFRVRATAMAWLAEGIPVSNGTWFHVITTWRQDRNLTVFINGSEVMDIGSETYPPNSPTIAGMHMGKRNNAFHSYAKGMVDEVYVWDRKLNASEALEFLCSYDAGMSLILWLQTFS